MNCLLVDNSNTRTKFALVADDRIIEVRMIPTSGITEENISLLLKEWHYAKVFICSVVPQAVPIIKQACQPAQVGILSAQMPLPVDFSSYEGLVTLGADRVANALAAARETKSPVVAIDLGTATTFDVVHWEDGEVRFLGGVIAPGLSSYAQCLQGRTALLPTAIIVNEVGAIGKTTAAALSSAVLLGYPAMIEGILSGIEKELGEKVNVVLTGGDAAWLAPRLSRCCKIDPMLTLRGIALAFGLRV